jgi:hypothetical protein
MYHLTIHRYVTSLHCFRRAGGGDRVPQLGGAHRDVLVLPDRRHGAPLPQVPLVEEVHDLDTARECYLLKVIQLYPIHIASFLFLSLVLQNVMYKFDAIIKKDFSNISILIRFN